jgi:hypothetical protein
MEKITLNGIKYKLVPVKKKKNIEYKIMSYRHNDKPITYYSTEITEDLLKNWKIRSVKRLSDGVIFKVGDYITGCTYEDKRAITSITIEEDELFFKYDHEGATSLEYAILHKLLFVTHDGVNIFEGDSYVKVDTNINNTIIFVINALSNQPDYKGLKFSTQAIAREYIAKQTRIGYSIDGIEFFVGDTIYYILKGYNVINTCKVDKDFIVLESFNYYFTSKQAAEDFILLQNTLRYIEALNLDKLNITLDKI